MNEVSKNIHWVSIGTEQEKTIALNVRRCSIPKATKSRLNTFLLSSFQEKEHAVFWEIPWWFMIWLRMSFSKSTSLFFKIAAVFPNPHLVLSKIIWWFPPISQSFYFLANRPSILVFGKPCSLCRGNWRFYLNLDSDHLLNDGWMLIKVGVKLHWLLSIFFPPEAAKFSHVSSTKNILSADSTAWIASSVKGDAVSNPVRIWSSQANEKE